jgi:RecJ-like exonuclease
MGLPQSIGVKEPCVRCRAKGIVVCPECQGTGDIRNESYVVVDRCHGCLKEWRGFITCPSCLGNRTVDSSQLRRSYRLERERMRIVPSVWGYENPASLSSPTPRSPDGHRGLK